MLAASAEVGLLFPSDFLDLPVDFIGKVLFAMYLKDYSCGEKPHVGLVGQLFGIAGRADFCVTFISIEIANRVVQNSANPV